MDKLDNRAASPLRIADRGAGAQLHALQHPSWIEFVRFCSELKHGEIENLKIQDGIPLLAEVVRRKIKFTGAE
jgi:hypothetical protein